MATFSSPAHKGTDRKLYATATGGLLKLQKKSRAELRQKGREEYWRLKLQANAAGHTISTNT